MYSAPRLAPLPRHNDSLVDRSFALALCGALLFHLLVLWGIGFARPERPDSPPRERLLEITVLHTPQPSEPPESPELLAQLNQLGGGTPDTPPRQPEVATVPPPSPPVEPTPEELPPSAPPPAASTPTPAAPAATTVPQPTPAPPLEPKVTPPAPLTPPARVATPSALLTPPARVATPRPLPSAAPPPSEPPAATPSPTPTLSAADLLRATQEEISLLSAEIDRRNHASSHAPRREFISASTREYRYAAYMDAWRRKVEQIGNLNYPEQARRDRIYGSLVLTVGIRQDGSVESIYVERSSGQRLLDEAAQRIVRLAAPYAPLPENIRRDVDILHITRTWHFRESHQLSSQ